MSYKTNARALRLGFSHDWSFKAHGSSENVQFDQKLAHYLTNLIEYVVPQAPQKAKTKGRQEQKFAVSPGIQGRIQVLRSAEQVNIIAFFYLNYDGAEPRQRAAFYQNFTNMALLVQREIGYVVSIKAINYFVIFWRFELFLGVGVGDRLKSRVQKAIQSSLSLQKERLQYSKIADKVRQTKNSVKFWGKERYFTRTFYPLVASFAVEPLDTQLLSKTIALELQILRVYHKHFMKYIKKMLSMFFYIWNDKNRIEGLKLEIRGRMTDFRRQQRRSQIKTIVFGKIKKSSFNVEASHSRSLAYNRYGVIGVSITYQKKLVTAEKSEKNWISTSALNHFFNVKEVVERYDSEQNYSNFRKNFVSPKISNAKHNSKSKFHSFQSTLDNNSENILAHLNQKFYQRQRLKNQVSRYLRYPAQQMLVIRKKISLTVRYQ